MPSEISRHGFGGGQTRSLTDQNAADIASGDFGNFILSTDTAISDEERLAGVIAVSFQSVHDSRDHDIIVGFDRSAGQTVGRIDDDLRFFADEGLEGFGAVFAEASAKVRSGQVSILAVAAGRKLFDSALLKEFGRELVENGVLAAAWSARKRSMVLVISRAPQCQTPRRAGVSIFRRRYSASL